MTQVQILPGPCGFVTKVTASAENRQTAKVQVVSGCKAVQAMMHELGDTFDAFELCLVKPGQGPLYEYASEHFPAHAACPVLAGITKCVEAECGLALKTNIEISFLGE